MEGSKELNDIFEAIEKWKEKHKGNVDYICAFAAFRGKEFEVFDDRLLAFGVKDCIKIDLDEMNKILAKDKEEFVNW